MKALIRRLYRRPLHAWKIGGIKLRLMAAYAIASPLIVVPMASGKLIAGFAAPWSLIIALVVIGHINSFTLAWLLFRHARVASSSSTA